MDKFVIVERYTNPISAQLALGRLQTEGIWAVLDDLNTIAINPLYSLALGGIKLKVLAEDAESARTILNQDFSDELD